MTPFSLPTTDGIVLQGRRWEGEGPPRAAIQIVHGVAEHAGRYNRLAAALNAAGFVVYAADLRGHGQTATGSDTLGFFSERDGWRKCLDDLWLIHRHIAGENPGLPIILLAHSMGSLMAQQFTAEHGDALAGVVLSGTDGPLSALGQAGRLVARLERLRLGPRGRSKLIFDLSFGKYNDAFRPTRTAFDWLSRDPAEVDRYATDPLNGFRPTNQLWIDLLNAVASLTSPARLAQIPKMLPIRVIAGTRDPVSEETRRIKTLLELYRRAGLERVSHHFYPDARHELFNETNRDEVTRDLLDWLNGIIPSG